MQVFTSKFTNLLIRLSHFNQNHTLSGTDEPFDVKNLLLPTSCPRLSMWSIHL